jgi:hypothetical protein
VTLFSLASATSTLTNAERMRRGISLNKPVVRSPSISFVFACPVPRSTHRAALTRRNNPSNVPQVYSGLIQVNQMNSNNIIGFLQLDGAQDRAIIGSSNSANTFTIIAGVNQVLGCNVSLLWARGNVQSVYIG